MSMPDGDPTQERHKDEFESRLQDNAARVGARHHRQYVYFAGSVTVIGLLMAVSAAINFTALRLLGSVFVLCSPFLFLQADRIGIYLASRSEYSA